MQLISCTQCRRTWEHREEKYPLLTEDDRLFIQVHHETPCAHKYEVEVNKPYNKELVSVFTEIPHIPTLSDTIDIDFVSFLFRREIDDRSLLTLYFEIKEDFRSIVDIRSTIDGECDLIAELVQYKQEEIGHLSYFEKDNPLSIFTHGHLSVLSYLHRKYPIKLYDYIEAWYKENNSLASFNHALDESF